jgi:UDP-glucose 4-epimerase
MAILVAGGAGFIGTHTCVELITAGYTPIIFDNHSNSKPEAIRRVEELTGKAVKAYVADMRDREALRAVFRENQIDAVIHFAGLKAVAESVSMPLEYYSNNITGTLTLLECMREAGCKRIVFSSSATVYGANPDVPFKESYPLMSATNPYGSTKLMLETIIKDLCVSDPEWSAVLLRYFNPVGAHPSGLLGEDPNGIPNNIMPIITQVAIGKLPVLNITGDDYDTPDGTGIRDYLHIMDLAAGHVKAYEYAMAHSGAEPINLGTGQGTSVMELVTAFEAACGKTLPKQTTHRRPGDIAICYADPGKAKELLGWETKLTLADMCRDSWNFISKNPNGL